MAYKRQRRRLPAGPLSQQIRQLLQHEQRKRGKHWLRDASRAAGHAIHLSTILRFIEDEDSTLRLTTAYWALKGLGYELLVVPIEVGSEKAVPIQEEHSNV